jgi:hypothetical protein
MSVLSLLAIQRTVKTDSLGVFFVESSAKIIVQHNNSMIRIVNNIVRKTEIA